MRDRHRQHHPLPDQGIFRERRREPHEDRLFLRHRLLIGVDQVAGDLVVEGGQQLAGEIRPTAARTLLAHVHVEEIVAGRDHVGGIVAHVEARALGDGLQRELVHHREAAPLGQKEFHRRRERILRNRIEMKDFHRHCMARAVRRGNVGPALAGCQADGTFDMWTDTWARCAPEGRARSRRLKLSASAWPRSCPRSSPRRQGRRRSSPPGCRSAR